MRQSVQELLDQAKALIKEAMDEAAGIVLYLHLEHGRQIRPTCREIVTDAGVPELYESLRQKVNRRKAETLANTEDSADRAWVDVRDQERQKKARQLLHVADPKAKREIISEALQADPTLADVVYRDAGEVIRNQPDRKARIARDSDTADRWRDALANMTRPALLIRARAMMAELRRYQTPLNEEERDLWDAFLDEVAETSMAMDTTVEVA